MHLYLCSPTHLPHNSPHAHALPSEKVLQLFSILHVRAHNHLALVIGNNAGVRPGTIDERRVHLELGECSTHPVCINHWVPTLCTGDQRLDRVQSTNLRTHQVSNSLGLIEWVCIHVHLHGSTYCITRLFT